MNNKTPLILGLLCLVLLGFILLFERNWESTTERKSQTHRLIKLDSDKVEKISIRNQHGDILLTKKDTRWSLREPLKYPAEQNEVEELLSDLKFLEQLQKFKVKNPAKDSEEYGLKKPRIVLKLNWDEEEIEIRIGRDTAMGKSVYAQLQKGNPEIFVIEGAIVDKLTREINAWRDKKLLEFEPAKVQSIRITQNKKELELTRKDGKWFLVRPLGARAGLDAVNNFLSDLAAARIQKFIADDTSDIGGSGFSEAQTKIVLKLEGQEKELGLMIGDVWRENSTWFYAKRFSEKNIFAVSTNLNVLLNQPLDYFRDKHIVSLDPAQIVRVALQKGTNRLEAFQTNGNWFLVHPIKAPANSAEIEKFISQCVHLEASQFVADAATDWKRYGLNQPTMQVILKSEQTNPSAPTPPTTVLYLGHIENENIFVRNEQEPFIWAVSTNEVAFLNVQAWDWRDLLVYDAKFDSFKEIEVLHTNTVVNILSKEGSTWKSDKGKVNTTDIEAIVKNLFQLRASRWLGPQYSIPSTVPDFQFRIKGKAAPLSLKIWKNLKNAEQIGSIAFYEGVSDWYFELSSADTILLLDPLYLPINTSTNLKH